jgi:ABC-type branched-subunit amino acid transport system substrate-binding protein
MVKKQKRGAMLSRRGVAAGLGSLMAAPVMPRRAFAASGELRVGALYPLSGGLNVLGTEALAGARVAVEMVNEAGGVGGQKVVLVEADATTPATPPTRHVG